MFMVYHDVSKYVGPASTLKRNYSTAGGWFITFDRKCGATPCVDFAPVHFCFGLVACSRGSNLAKTLQKPEQERCICPYSMATSSNQQTINQKPTRNLTWLFTCIHCDLDWWFQFLSATLKKRKTHTSWFYCCLWAAKQANQFGWEMGSKTKKWKTSPWFSSRMQGHTASSIWQH